jgi:transcription termination/antitermination protein NusG
VPVPAEVPAVPSLDGGRAADAWFGLRTMPRHEKLVHERLVGRGVESFLPLWIRCSRWTDRKKKVALPLFPGYCFARFSLDNKSVVVRAAGVIEIVGTAGVPEPVEEREIVSLQALVRSGMEYDPHPGLVEGMAVEVVRGPLSGVRGVVVRKESHCRLVILVNVIRQGASVEVDAGDVTPV